MSKKKREQPMSTTPQRVASICPNCQSEIILERIIGKPVADPLKLNPDGTRHFTTCSAMRLRSDIISPRMRRVYG